MTNNNPEPKHVTIDGVVYVKASNQPEKGYHSPAFERSRSSYEQPLRDNLACAEVKLDKIDELITQVHAHLAAERAYISGEAGYYR